MKILMMGGEAAVGGVAEVIRLLFRILDPRKTELHVTVADTPNKDKYESITTHTLQSGYNLFSLPWRAAQLRRLIRRNRFDLLHLHTTRAGLLGCLAAAGLPVKIVYTGHGWRFEHKGSPAARFLFYCLERYICSRASVVLFVTERDRNVGIRERLVRPEKSVVIPMRLERGAVAAAAAADARRLRAELGLSQGALIIGMVGAMDERKDPFTFVKAAARLITQVPEASFVWIGDGPLREQTLRLAASLGLGDRLKLPGVLPHPEFLRLLRAMDVLLFTSRCEAFPMSILDAQAARIAVVCSAYPGVEQLLEHGKTGYLFPPGDDLQAALWTMQALSDTETTSVMVQAAYNQVGQKYTGEEPMAREYEQVYASALQPLTAL